jgi:hypothetical protein
MKPDIFEAICSEIETATDGIVKISKRHGTDYSAFRLHLAKSEVNYLRYTRAREIQLDYLEELLRELTFDGSKDERVINGTVNIGSNHIQRDRLKVDTLKFILSKLRPHVYGQKLTVDIVQEPRIFNID